MSTASELLQQHLHLLVDDNAAWQKLIADDKSSAGSCAGMRRGLGQTDRPDVPAGVRGVFGCAGRQDRASARIF